MKALPSEADVGADIAHDVHERVTARALRAVAEAEADGEDTITVMTRGFEGFVAALSDVPEIASFLREAWLVADLDELNQPATAATGVSDLRDSTGAMR